MFFEATDGNPFLRQDSREKRCSTEMVKRENRVSLRRKKQKGIFSCSIARLLPEDCGKTLFVYIYIYIYIYMREDSFFEGR